MKLFEGRTDPVVLHRATRQIAAVAERFKLIQSADGKRELYDLFEDPGELHNLIDRRPEEAQRLGAYVRTWLETTPAYAVPTADDESLSAELLKLLRGLGYVDEE